ncbi:unnamed protein product [Rhizoctonia solani]|uniref:Uncharacterized protein n=1 Tax=Rhizoctonia solani TaxID=456999 RepID=A0A8H3C0T5_9AGAM|nr:unnamed protein product [Rhizoctonia solani]
MKLIAFPAVLLLVASGAGARPQEDTSSISVFPLPTIVPDPPTISSGFPPIPSITPSLTPRPPTSTAPQPTTTGAPSTSDVETSSVPSSQTSGLTTALPTTSPIASATSSVASSVASASPTNNAAMGRCEPLKVHGLAALGVATGIFASMLVVL